MKEICYGSFLANAGKLTLETADNRKVTINKNYIQAMALRMFGLHLLGLRIRMKYIIELLGPKKGEKVLDAGCGTGINSMYLAKNGLHMYGADTSNEKIESARRICKKLNINVKFSAVSINQLPYEDETFDKLICTEVLEHVENDRHAMKELTRVLKNNGSFILSVPDDNSFNKKNMERFGHVRTGYSMDDINGIAKTHNLEIIKTVGVMSFFGKLAWNINHMMFFSKVLTVISFWPLYYLTLLDQLLGINIRPISCIVKFRKKIVLEGIFMGTSLADNISRNLQ